MLDLAVHCFALLLFLEFNHDIKTCVEPQIVNIESMYSLGGHL